MIEAHDVTKNFGSNIAVDDLNLTVDESQWFLMVGHNGAGKTTTIRMLAGLLPPTKGRMRVAGVDPREDPVGARRRLGYLPERFEPYDYLSPREYLRFISDVHGLDTARQSKSIESLLELLDLEEHGDELMRGFSQGMKKKVGLCAALIHDPPVLFLDEPTATLDPRTSHLIRKLIRELANRGKTIFMSTHILGIAEQECDRIVMLDRGHVLLDASPGTLSEDYPGRSLEDVFLEIGGGTSEDRIAKYLEEVGE